MKVMKKYKLEMGMNVITVPGGLCGIHIAAQPGTQGLCQLWTMACVDAPEVTHNILVVGEGAEIEDKHYASPIGTVLLNGGAQVFHVLLVKEPVND